MLVLSPYSPYVLPESAAARPNTPTPSVLSLWPNTPELLPVCADA